MPAVPLFQLPRHAPASRACHSKTLSLQKLPHPIRLIALDFNLAPGNCPAAAQGFFGFFQEDLDFGWRKMGGNLTDHHNGFAAALGFFPADDDTMSFHLARLGGRLRFRGNVRKHRRLQCRKGVLQGGLSPRNWNFFTQSDIILQRSTLRSQVHKCLRPSCHHG